MAFNSNISRNFELEVNSDRPTQEKQFFVPSAAFTHTTWIHCTDMKRTITKMYHVLLYIDFNIFIDT